MPAQRGRRAGSPTGAHRYPRTARVNQLLREVIADELERIADLEPRLGILSVTAVVVEADLRHATVYLSSLSEQAVEVLDEQRSRLQSAIAKQVRMKRTPLLAFVADPAVAEGARIEDIIRDLGGQE
jgi:ribosome-binding factor A